MRENLLAGDRAQVQWHRGDAGCWYSGTLLQRGRVRLDDYVPFVSTLPFILEPEEIAARRQIGQSST